MTIYYVDSNASGLNNGTSWTDAYADLSTAIAGSVAAGDTIHVASNHTKTYTSTTTLAFPSNCTVISVNSSTDNYESGATEATSSGDFTIAPASFSTWLYIYGVNLTANDDVQFNKGGCQYYLYDLTLTLTGTSGTDYFRFNADGVFGYLKDVTFSVNASGQTISLYSGTRIVVEGGSVNSTCTRFVDAGQNGGGTVEITGTDFSAMTSGEIVDVAAHTDDTINAVINRCKVPSGVSITSTASTYNDAQTIDAYSCDSGDGYHEFENIRYGGSIYPSTSVYRSGGATYDGTTNFSASIVPVSNVGVNTVNLKHKLGNYELDLTSANTLTFHIAFGDNTSAITAFKNDEMWIEIEQNDATDNALGLLKDTKPTDILTTSSTLTASTETWTGLTHTNTDKRQIAITTDVVAGMTKGQVTAYLCCAKHISTLGIYACPSPVVT